MTALTVTRDGVVGEVRRLLRQVTEKPLTDDMIWDAMEDATDELSTLCPFYYVTKLIDSVQDQREYVLPMDIFHVIDVHYTDPDGGTTVRLEATTQRNLGDSGYMDAESGIPTSYYIDTGVLGLDVPTASAGTGSIIVHCYGRPDAISRVASPDQALTWLPLALRKAYKYKVASILAAVLGQDQTALQQVALWQQEYLAGIARYNELRHQMDRGIEAQVIPITGR